MNNEKIHIQLFRVGPYPINGYLISDPQTNIGAFIDPGGFHEEICDYIANKKIDLEKIFITHGHYDHTDGLAEFVMKWQAEVFAGSGEISITDHVLNGGEKIKVGNLTVRTLATPGHTGGGISYSVEDYVFTGDALFCGTVGGTSSPQAADQQLASVRNTIFTLPVNTFVMPAHGPLSTVEAEKQCNPFFK
ncbi:MAG: MBL fold metallo-hydrolase [Planctomycetota bacterium]|jgi:glyoxylase-like metal-dependent hydrolase (beta-lactamase superfamily II)